MTGGGWRAVTKKGACSGGGSMNYDLDMPPYIQEMADWLDDRDSARPSLQLRQRLQRLRDHDGFLPLGGQGGQVALPLDSGMDSGMDEIQLLRDTLPARRVILSMPESAKEYPA